MEYHNLQRVSVSSFCAGSNTGGRNAHFCCLLIMMLYSLPRGQYGYSGHVSNLLQDT